PQLPTRGAADLERYRAAINAGLILPDQPGSAFAMLTPLKTALDPDRYIDAENELRLALDNKGQEILLRYLQGDENPQTQAEFAMGGRYMGAARQLTRDSLFLEARDDFFKGRALLFDKTQPSYQNAATLLEQAVRIDPNTAYGFNA